jgi:MYXO-CTERM domain-containing protein
MILGEIQMGATALGAGESTIMSLDVYDPDGTELTFAWQEDPLLLEAGHNGFDSVTTQTVTWTAPSNLSDSSPGEVYTLYVVVTDPEGNSDWAFGEVTVYPEPVALALGAISTEDTGCGSGDEDDEASSAAIVAPMLLLALGLRRRRD